MAEQLVLSSRGQQGETSAPVFSFFGGEEEEEQPEIQVIEDQTLLPTTAPLDDSQPPQDFLDSITEEVIKAIKRRSGQTEMKIAY